MLNRIINAVDRRLGHPLPIIKKQMALNNEVRMYNAARAERHQKYASFAKDAHREVVEQLERDGVAIVRNAVDPQLMLDIKAEMNALLDNGQNLLRVSKDSARKPGDVGLPTVFLTPEELAQGQDYQRQHTNYISIADPLISTPSTLKVVFMDLLLDIAAGYHRAFPALEGLNLRKSFQNSLPDFDTLYFHCDPGSPHYFKFFFYLNDVDKDGGPFCYVRGSHKKKFNGWLRKYRWSHEEIAKVYGEENIVYTTANVGDLVIANTFGFHRGTKVTGAERHMLTIDYLIHRDFAANGVSKVRMNRADYEKLTSKQKAAADFVMALN